MNLKIKDYVNVLPRFIDRLSITRKVETTFDFLADVKSQLEEFNEIRGNAKLPKTLDKFGKAVKGLNRIGKPAKPEPLFVIVEALKITLNNKTRITDYVKREISADVSTAAISYKKANILIYISSLNNIGQLLNNLLWLMTIDESTKDSEGSMTKAVYTKTINDLNNQGSEMVKVLSGSADDIINAFNKVPDVVVDDGDEGDAFINNTVADPLRLGFLPANNANPFFFAGKALIAIEDYFYRQRLDMKQMLELRLADLRARDDAAESPQLQAEIEKLENKLATLNYKLDKALGGNV